MNFVSNYPRPSRYLVKSETFCQSRYRYSYYMLHYSPIYPFLIYGVHAWVLTFPSFLTPLLVIQKKAIRIITFSEPRSHSAISQIITLQVLSFVYQWSHRLLPPPFHKDITFASSFHSYSTHQSCNGHFYVTSVNTTQYIFLVKRWRLEATF